MTNQEIPDFFKDDSDEYNKKMLETCENLYDSELTSRGLTWQRFKHNPDTDKYLIIFGTKEGLYIEVEEGSIKECFEQAIIAYDRAMADKKVPLDPIPSDRLVVSKGETSDLIESSEIKFQKIREQLVKDPSKASKEDAEFFLNIFKSNIVDDDFEIAVEAQKILDK